MRFADVLRRQRLQRGFTQAKLAAAVGLHQRQIARYEAGIGEPPLNTAVALAELLDVPLAQLAGIDNAPDLHGTWRGATEILTDDGMAVMADFDIDIDQDGSTLDLRGRPSDQGPVDTWRGRVRFNDDDRTLPGTFHVTHPVTATGTLFFTLDPGGHALTGRWVTATPNHGIATGWTALTRDGTSPRTLLDDLVQTTTA